MALDPQIALGYRPPQINLDVPSPIQQYGQMLTLRGLMEQQQLRGLQIEQAQQEIAQNRLAAESEANFRKLYSDPSATPTRGQIFGTLGTKAPTVIKGLGEVEEQDLKLRAARAARLGSLAGGITDAVSLNRNLLQAVSERLIDPETGRQLMTAGWTPDTGKQIKQFGLQSLTYAQQLEQQRQEAEEKRKAQLFTPQFEEAQAKSLAERLGLAAQTAPNNQPEWSAWWAGLKPDLQKRISPFFSPTAREQVRMLGVKPTAPLPGRDIPYSPEVQAQKVEEAAARASVLQSPEKIEQDLQIKRRQLELQSQANVNKAMSGDASKVYSIASNLQPGLEQLRQAFKRDYRGTLHGILMGTNPELAKLASNVADQIGRLRSGGAVNPSEEKRFMDQIASRSDLVFGRLDAALAALDRYSSEAKSVADNLKPSGGGAQKPATHRYNPATGKIEEIHQ